jgi:hypothetical protein
VGFLKRHCCRVAVVKSGVGASNYLACKVSPPPIL